MRSKFEKYWKRMKNINKFLVIDFVFDSSKKMQFAKICFQKIYGNEIPKSKDMYQSVHNVMIDMFKEYTTHYKIQSAQLSSQSTQASSSTGKDQGLGDSIEGMDVANDDFGYKIMDFDYTEISATTKMVAEIGVEEEMDELELYLMEKVKNPKTLLGT